MSEKQLWMIVKGTQDAYRIVACYDREELAEAALAAIRLQRGGDRYYIEDNPPPLNPLIGEVLQSEKGALEYGY